VASGARSSFGRLTQARASIQSTFTRPGDISMAPSLIDPYLPPRIERALQSHLAVDETIQVKLKGAFKEALVCTDRRILIIKGGFMTGQIFGTNAFQSPYANIAGVEVKFHLLTGYFELSAGGMQNTPQRSYWSQQPSRNAAVATNCVTLNSRSQAAKFREACSFILEMQGKQQRSIIGNSVNRRAEENLNSGDTIIQVLRQLGELRDRGIIKEDEFEAKKRELLDRL
jgi:hypothetical protein